jgi:hypothetical protein
MSQAPSTIGELRRAEYRVLPVRTELRRNLIRKLSNREELFGGIRGYDDSVIPQIENAILAGHDIILLGERGQAKSRLIRGLVTLLDEWSRPSRVARSTTIRTSRSAAVAVTSSPSTATQPSSPGCTPDQRYGRSWPPPTRRSPT